MKPAQRLSFALAVSTLVASCGLTPEPESLSNSSASALSACDGLAETECRATEDCQPVWSDEKAFDAGVYIGAVRVYRGCQAAPIKPVDPCASHLTEAECSADKTCRVWLKPDPLAPKPLTRTASTGDGALVFGGCYTAPPPAVIDPCTKFITEETCLADRTCKPEYSSNSTCSKTSDLSCTQVLVFRSCHSIVPSGSVKPQPDAGTR
jgi:hypothetical protein